MVEGAGAGQALWGLDPDDGVDGRLDAALDADHWMGVLSCGRSVGVELSHWYGLRVLQSMHPRDDRIDDGAWLLGNERVAGIGNDDDRYAVPEFLPAFVPFALGLERILRQDMNFSSADVADRAHPVDGRGYDGSRLLGDQGVAGVANERDADARAEIIAHLVAALGRLEALVPDLDAARFGIGHIAIGCALGYLDFRFNELGWRMGRPALAAWQDDFAARPSSIATEVKDG